MIVTEDEARKLWCPMARIAPVYLNNKEPAPNIPAANRFGDDFAKCIASECMFWKFVVGASLASGGAEAYGTCGFANEVLPVVL
jgi:hypothetical protein